MAQKKIVIADMITVGELAAQLDLPVTKLIGELFKNGIMATVNQRIDLETAQIIIDELGLNIQLEKKEAVEGPAAREGRALSDKATERLTYLPTRADPFVTTIHLRHGRVFEIEQARQF